MTNKTLERLREELDDWRARLEHLRVQANLGEKEARDKLNALEERLTPAFQKAVRYLDEVIESGTDEARTLAVSLRAGWKEMRRTHREAVRSKTHGGTGS